MVLCRSLTKHIGFPPEKEAQGAESLFILEEGDGSLGKVLQTECGNAAHHGGEDGFHLVFLRLSEPCDLACQAAADEDLVGSQALVHIAHLCQVCHARGNALQHADELRARQLPLVFL